MLSIFSFMYNILVQFSSPTCHVGEMSVCVCVCDSAKESTYAKNEANVCDNNNDVDDGDNVDDDDNNDNTNENCKLNNN